MEVIFERGHAGALDTIKCTVFSVDGRLAHQKELWLYSLMTWFHEVSKLSCGFRYTSLLYASHLRHKSYILSKF